MVLDLFRYMYVCHMQVVMVSSSTLVSGIRVYTLSLWLEL